MPMVLPRKTTSFGMSGVMLVMASSKRASSPVNASSGNNSSAMRLDAMRAVALTSTGANVPRPRAWVSALSRWMVFFEKPAPSSTMHSTGARLMRAPASRSRMADSVRVG